MAFAKVVCAIVFLIIAHPVYALYRNYGIAKRIGLPVLVNPIYPFNPLWMVLGPLVFPLMKRVPIQIIRDWALLGDVGFPFADLGDIHKRRGHTFLSCTPNGTTLITDDPQATDHVLRHTNVFIKPNVIYGAIEFFGKNVDTVNGEAWSRHRRLTTPPFNERNSGLVWKESLKQAKGMIAHWVGKDEVGGDATSTDTMKLALHVLTSAGFGKTYDFDVGSTTVPDGHVLSYRDALAGILKNLLVAIIASMVKLPLWMLPQAFRDMKICQAEFKKYMVEMTTEQRAAMKVSSQKPQEDNLMSALVRANEVSRAEGKERYALSDDEIYGNLFIWNLAGHDTTATSLAYAFTMLSADRDVQDWVSEEINAICGNTPLEDWDYEAIFPKLKRCMAVMYETLRLFGPVTSMQKQVLEPQRLEIAGETYDIPGNYMLTLNYVSIHYSEKHWGADAQTWRPSRFIKDDELVVPSPTGTFLPWITGPRVCPGKKFAQVEFVATMATCLREHRIRAVAQPGETRQQISKRVYGVACDSEMAANPTLKMKHPENISFKWESA